MKRIDEADDQMTMAIPKDSEIFIRVPSESAERVLHSGIVIDSTPDSLSARLERGCPELDVDDVVLLYFLDQNRFMQRPAEVMEVLSSDPLITISIDYSGDAISADSREDFRVSTISSDLTADLGEEKHVEVRDISASGFSVLASKNHLVGSQHEIKLYYDDDILDGTASVQSIREISAGQFRYGLHVDSTSEGGMTFRTGLNRITMAVQREHLQRLSRVSD